MAQRLATVVHRDGYDASTYRARHDPGLQYESGALFGPAGANDAGEVFTTCATLDIASAVVEAGTQVFGIDVLADPPGDRT